MRLLLVALLLALPARADTPPAGDEAVFARGILDDPDAFRIESMRFRFSYFDQQGHGYQSQAQRATAAVPGSERLSVKQYQGEIVARQGKFTHTLWVPVDVVTGASPDALDAVTGSSRVNEAGTLDLSTTYHASEASEMSVRTAFHVEEPFRSWLLGVGGARSFADGNTTVAASLNQAFDWFDQFDLHGKRQGAVFRSSSNANLSLTQLLSPTTVGSLGYGVTLQMGELSNTWNAVPLSNGELGREKVPALRQRHAFSGRLAQALPWRAALKALYRYYLDDWGLRAHTVEGQLSQRLVRWAHLRGTYRRDFQTGARFFSLAAPIESWAWRTADSDLAPFAAATYGLMLALDLDFVPEVQALHLDLGVESYIRSNDLRAMVYTCSLGLSF
jgi:hypothetical protein